MLNLFKMEIHRALKTKVTNIILLIMGALSFLGVFSSTMGMNENESLNISTQFTGIISSQMTLILWAIMISVYISGEYKNGFVKSIAGQISDRGYLAVSKLLFSILYTIEMFILSFIFVVISAFVFNGSNVVFGFSPEMITLWGIQVLLYVGVSCIFILVSNITRSSALGIALGIFMGCGLTGIIYTGISWVVNKSGIVSNFNLGNYMIETNIQYMQPGIPQEYIIKAVLVGLVFIAVMTFASIQVLRKRDI